MASDVKKAKAAPEAKATPAPKTETPAPKKEAAPAADTSTPDATPAKAEGGEAAVAAPKNYSRGEGQKPVTQAYKDNWNAIFGTKAATPKKAKANKAKAVKKAPAKKTKKTKPKAKTKKR